MLVLLSVAKNLYYPPIHYDAVYGYTLYAKMILHQGTFNPTIEHVTHRFYYPPLVALNIVACYILEINEKLPNSLYFMLLLIVFYVIVRKHTSALVAALTTLIICITNEFYSHSALSLTNLPAAVFVGCGFLFLYDKRYKWSTLFYALAGFTRSESVLFIFVATVFIFFTDRKALKIHLFAYIPFFAWFLYLKYIGISMNNFGLQLNVVRLPYMWEVLKSAGLYGVTMYLILISLIFYHKNKIALYTISSFVLFVIMYLLLDASKMGCADIKLISAGFKRGMFYFIPLGGFNVAAWLQSL